MSEAAADAVCLVQARMSSTRLPGKVLRPLAGQPVLAHVVDRAAAIGPVLICTSEHSSDDAIARWCADAGHPCFRGSLEDVFARYLGALATPGFDRSGWFFRVTADCPLLDGDLMRRLLAAREPADDHLGFDQSAMPLGLSAELVRRAAFERAARGPLSAAEREHVTLALYDHPDRFRSRRIPPPIALRRPELRLTLDTVEDYDRLAALFEGRPALTAAQAVAMLSAGGRA